MKDWSDLEEKYQDMRLADPKAAQSFKQRMTARFQVCIASSVLRICFAGTKSDEGVAIV